MEAIPLRIQSQKTLSCQQDQGTCTAEGDVNVTRGNFHLNADQVHAQFVRNKVTGKQLVDALEASGNVTLSLPDLRGKGSLATYRASSGDLTLTHNASLHVHGIDIFSLEPFTFNHESNRGWVKNAHVVFREQKATFLCQTLHFSFQNRKALADGARPFRVTARKVLFSAETVTVQADCAVYDTNAGTLTLTGNIFIAHAPHVAHADKAIYHLKTKQLSVFPSSSKKIKGVIQTKNRVKTILPKT